MNKLLELAEEMEEFDTTMLAKDVWIDGEGRACPVGEYGLRHRLFGPEELRKTDDTLDDYDTLFIYTLADHLGIDWRDVRSIANRYDTNGLHAAIYRARWLARLRDSLASVWSE